MDDNKITFFAQTDARNKKVPFGIKSKDRSRHVYIIGKTGMGKSTMLENMAIQDIQNGEGMAFIDPHGKTADLLLDYVPKERIGDVVYFAPFDTDYPISFNVMEDVGADKRHLVANGLMSAFKKIWVDAWSARMEYILNNILLALLEYPDSTLIGVNRMLADKEYRKAVVDNVSDPSVKAFWIDEFAKYGDRYMQEAGAAIQNKIGQFVSNPLVRNIIGQPKSTFDIRKLMDEKKLVIINLSKGRVGEQNANLLGSMIITKIYLAAMSRADVSDNILQRLPQFYLYVDEFQSFANESFADILSEARKYKLNLTIAHQYIEQMSEEVRAAVFGNVGSMVVFRVGAYDAEVLEKEFAPVFTAEDLVNLGFVQIYLKLMIDGVSSTPFSATTLPPIKKPEISFRDDIIENSRKVFARPRKDVEDLIREWHQQKVAGDRSKDKESPRRSLDKKPERPQENFSEAKRYPDRPSAKPLENSGEAKNNHPQTVKPFANLAKVIVQENKVPAPQKNAISLDHLKKENTIKNSRGPTEKNLSELREALAAVSKKPQEVKNEDKKNGHELEKKEKAEPVKKEEVKHIPEEPKEKNKESRREVPEDVLKKILEMGDEEK